MVDIILCLLALLIFEAAVLVGAVIWKTAAGERKGGAEKREETAESGDFEKRWQEGIDAMMGYDVTKARNAARRDEDEK